MQYIVKSRASDNVIPLIDLYFLFRRNLGGKFGASIMEDLQVETMGDLLKFSLPLLQEKYGDKNG